MELTAGWGDTLQVILGYGASIILLLVLLLGVSAWFVRVRQGAKDTDTTTLGLRKGAVRSFLVLFYSSLGVVLLVGPLDVEADIKKWVTAGLATMVAFYFATKILEK